MGTTPQHIAVVVTKGEPEIVGPKKQFARRFYDAVGITGSVTRRQCAWLSQLVVSKKFSRKLMFDRIIINSRQILSIF